MQRGSYHGFARMAPIQLPIETTCFGTARKMKTERRHELQTNVLADWLGQHLEQVKGYSKAILAVILLVTAAVIAGAYLIQDQASRSQASWGQFFQAFGERSPEALEIVASSHPGTPTAVWAKQAEGDIKLAEGIGDLYTNRDNAKKNLAAAEKSYLMVVANAKEKMLKERAWFGLGQVYESMSDLEKAREYYGQLAQSSPSSALGKEAQRRVDALSDPAAEKWYNWFANQKPRPPALPSSPDGLPGLPGLDLPNLPSDLGELSDRPDLSLPIVPPVAPSATTPAPAAPDPPATEEGAAAPEPAKPPTESEPNTPDASPAESPEDAN